MTIQQYLQSNNQSKKKLWVNTASHCSQGLRNSKKSLCRLCPWLLIKTTDAVQYRPPPVIQGLCGKGDMGQTDFRDKGKNSASHAESKQEQLHQKQPTKPQQPLEPPKSSVKSAQLMRGEGNGRGGAGKPGRRGGPLQQQVQLPPPAVMEEEQLAKEEQRAEEEQRAIHCN